MPVPPQAVAREQRDHQDARQHAGDEQLADVLLGDDRELRGCVDEALGELSGDNIHHTRFVCRGEVFHESRRKVRVAEGFGKAFGGALALGPPAPALFQRTCGADVRCRFLALTAIGINGAGVERDGAFKATRGFGVVVWRPSAARRRARAMKA